MILYRCDRCGEDFKHKKEVQTLYLFKFLGRPSDASTAKIEEMKDLCQKCVGKAFEFINKGDAN